MLTQKNFLDQLGELIAIPSLAGNAAANAAALDYIETLISPEAQVKRIKNGNAEILLAGTRSTMKPEFGYLVHVDVVAAPDDLFALKQKNGFVYGRGVSDMKFSVPIGIALLNEIIESGTTANFTLAVTTDEELGGYEGAKYLAEKLKWRPEVLIVPDGGDNMQFVNKSKGIAQFEIMSKGKTAHASRPWQGENAIAPLGLLITKLNKKYGKNTKKENWKTTVNFGFVSGGISTNQVCDQAVLRVDFRFPETETVEGIEKEVRDVAASCGSGLSVTRLSYGPPTFTDTNNPEVRRFLAVLEHSYGQKIAVKPAYGASDARHFAPYGIPVLMIKPMGGDIHCDTEWLDVESALVFYQALGNYLGITA